VGISNKPIKTPVQSETLVGRIEEEFYCINGVLTRWSRQESAMDENIYLCKENTNHESGNAP
jgi:hypothetical protein